MNTINEYKNRFYNLLESTIGDVRPLITEDEKTETEQIAKNLGFELDESITGYYDIINANKIFATNFEKASLTNIDNIVELFFVGFKSNMSRKGYKEYIQLYIQNVTNKTNIDTIKNIVNSFINGTINKNLIKGENPDASKFYEFYEKNSLNGYDADIYRLNFYLKDGNSIENISPTIEFYNKNQNDKIKKFIFYGFSLEVQVYYGNTIVNKEYVLSGNTISFEKDRKSTKTVGKFTGGDLFDLSISDRYVKYGMRGDIVKQIQQALLKSGQLTTAFQLARDNEACKEDHNKCHGTFGPKTYAAVKEFQAANDLVQDGIVGPDTADALSGVR